MLTEDSCLLKFFWLADSSKKSRPPSHHTPRIPSALTSLIRMCPLSPTHNSCPNRRQSWGHLTLWCQNDVISCLMTSFLCFLTHKLLRPPQSVSDVTAASCSLGNQKRAAGASAKVTTHCHCPIRGWDGCRVLRERVQPIRGVKSSTAHPWCYWQVSQLPLGPGRHTEPSQNAPGERVALHNCEELQRSADSLSSSEPDRNQHNSCDVTVMSPDYVHVSTQDCM